MPVSDRTTEERTRARKSLKDLVNAPVALPRPVYFVPGWRDEHGGCWAGMKKWLPYVVREAEKKVFFVEYFAADGGLLPPWEDFLDFGDDLAELVHKDHDHDGQLVDLVCHSMGGLDAIAAISMLDDQPGLVTPPLRCVHTVITFDTPFRGFGAAENELFAKFVESGRKDPWVRTQLAAMQKDSKRIAEVLAAKDDFLANVTAFWPRGADNYDGVLEVPHESASFGRAEDFAPAVRGRYQGYRSWPDTSHSGPANGVTHDLRAILETVQILSGTK